MKKYIKMAIVWSLPDTEKEIVTQYILPVPQGLTPSYYLWVATGMRLLYKHQCLINRMKRKKEYVFIPKKEVTYL